MAISVFELFKIGIGPSSSHTVGPMQAARRFVAGLAESGTLTRVAHIGVELYGSLGATGKGHGSDVALILGLMGEAPDSVDTDSIPARLDAVRASGSLPLALAPGSTPQTVAFAPGDIVFVRKSLPFHPNGMRFVARAGDGSVLAERTFYSVGGGFIVEPGDEGREARLVADATPLPLPFANAAELVQRCAEQRLTVSALMLANEGVWRPEAETRAGLLRIWQTMQGCVARGVQREGTLPGGMKVRRRAADLYRQLCVKGGDALQVGAGDTAPGVSRSTASRQAPGRGYAEPSPDTANGHYRAGLQNGDPLDVLDWVTLCALAVNEENAAGGRVVTAPTNGAAGIIPAVLHYYTRFVPGATPARAVNFLLTAGAIALLYKQNASISGAEVGCQGEVGVACSMAAGALAEVLGGSVAQVENAAEIGMEHHLGLTCDPVGGLVQIPCIERNAMASVTAIQAARLALAGDGRHHVSLDRVIKTMRETGADMKSKYKETARGGLAVNVVEC